MQVHPAFKPALAAMCLPVQSVPMRRFEVRVRTDEGAEFTYLEHYFSSFDAAQAAIERHGQHARISVRALP